MRKLLVFAFVMSFAGVLRAGQDMQGSMRPAIWRSSRSCGTIPWVELSTGIIFVHAIVIDSATVNSNAASYLALFNSSAVPITSLSANFLSTGIFVGANVSNTASATPNILYYPFDIVFSSGVTVSKTGISCTSVLWDYLIPTIRYDIPYFP